jgi:hypothetical protein
MFTSCHPFSFFDYFRVPYAVEPTLAARCHGRLPGSVHRLRQANPSSGPARSLLWTSPDTDPAVRPDRFRLGRYRLRDCTFCAHVALGAEAPGILPGLGRGWHPIEQILDEDGGPQSAVWQDDDGSIFLPFDPGELMLQFWSEGYGRSGRSWMARSGRDVLLHGYYLVRPALPRRLQLRLRRAYTHVQGRSSFPSWPVEDSLHTFYAWLFGLLAGLTGEPVPYLDPWPDNRAWALVLTHDVETEAGYRDLELLRGPERELGYRSSWNFVPLRYRVPDELLHALRQEGCEVGVHGLRHDGRDLGSSRLLARRLPFMREYADRWQAVGFRSPATQRQWDMMPRLGFEYDSSYTDTDPYEPQPGGCCSYLPYFNENLVELPITLPQDHTLFAILQHPNADMWLRKARLLRERHAMLLALTHPDYAGDHRVAEGYRSLLEAFRGDGTVWHALPREVATWWRERASSALCWAEDGWRIEGPAAARARIRFATADARAPGDSETSVADAHRGAVLSGSCSWSRRFAGVRPVGPSSFVGVRSAGSQSV